MLEFESLSGFGESLRPTCTAIVIVLVPATALRLEGNGCQLAFGFLLGNNCFVSPTLPKTGSLAASALLSQNSTRSSRVGKPFLSLILRASSFLLICSTTDSFTHVFAKFDMFISEREFSGLKVPSNVLDRSPNFCSSCPSFYDMFGPSNKASTHAYATIFACPKRCYNIFGVLPRHFFKTHNSTSSSAIKKLQQTRHFLSF